MRHPSAIAIAIALTATPIVADAKPKKANKASKAKQAKVHTDKAAKAHKAGNYDEALTELEAAYEIDPQPKLLFAIAQVQQKLDKCDQAIPNYEKFVAKEKDKQKKAVVKQAIAACKTKIASAPTPPPDDNDVFRKRKPEADEPAVAATEPAPPVETTPPPPPPQPELAPAPAPEPTPIVDDNPLGPPMRAPEQPARSGGSPFYKDILGDVLVLGGVGAGVVSFVMYSNAKSDLDAAEDAATIDEYDALVDRAYDRRTYAVVLAAGGVALVGAGILRFALRDNGESRRVAVTPTQGGGLITFAGGF